MDQARGRGESVSDRLVLLRQRLKQVLRIANGQAGLTIRYSEDLLQTLPEQDKAI